MDVNYTKGFPNSLAWPLRYCPQLKSHPATFTRGATYTRDFTVGRFLTSMIKIIYMQMFPFKTKKNQKKQHIKGYDRVHKSWFLYGPSMKWNDIDDIIQWEQNSEYRANSRLAPSQWEMLLQSNGICHWLGTNLESALDYIQLTMEDTWVRVLKSDLYSHKNTENIHNILMASRKAAVRPVHQHWSYHSLVLSHRYNNNIRVNEYWPFMWWIPLKTEIFFNILYHPLT